MTKHGKHLLEILITFSVVFERGPGTLQRVTKGNFSERKKQNKKKTTNIFPNFTLLQFHFAF